ncbi:hypothetical protein SOVF_100410 [Spinacia oleracea]|uniref:Uncharacterized protein n=1 Tax=Spinacia oleracea TaxID=3562 RepID=A0A9R0IAM9_SPIOL|nr:uncharacterized protein LOC110785576 [Spinacia oleracea]KNA15212.1 hypothetical protein SOVF_100410 [Spinacia oleracea]
MGRFSKWTAIMIAISICLLLCFSLKDPPLQGFTSPRSHYWDKLKLPLFSDRFSLLWPSSQHIQGNGVQGIPNEGNVALERESKVIEAAEESLEKTKMMIEDSAKTVADMVGDAVHKTKDIAKETFSKPTLASQHQDEL